MKTILIGKKLTRKSVLMNLLLLTPFALMGAGGYLGVIAVHLNTSAQIDKLIAICIFGLTMIFLMPVIASSQTLEINEQTIRLYNASGFMEQLGKVLHVLMNKEDMADLIVNLDQVDQIKLSFSTFLMIYSTKAFQIQLTLLLKDGTLIKIAPEAIEAGEDLENALVMLEHQGIKIADQLKLRKAFHMKRNDGYQYMLEIYERNHQS